MEAEAPYDPSSKRGVHHMSAGSLHGDCLVLYHEDGSAYDVHVPDDNRLLWDLYCEKHDCDILDDQSLSLVWKDIKHTFRYKFFDSKAALINAWARGEEWQ